MRNQERHVLAPLPERGSPDREDVEPVVEVGPEPPAADLGRQVPVRRRHDAHVDAANTAVADAPQLAFLKYPQEAALHGGARVADLVEEERSAVRELEETGAIGVRAGEGAPRVAKELALDKGVGDRREVVRKEGTLGAGALCVERPRDQLLPGAGLAVYEHRRRARRQGGDPPPQLDDAPARADQAERIGVRAVPVRGELPDLDRLAAGSLKPQGPGLQSHSHPPCPRDITGARPPSLRPRSLRRGRRDGPTP